MKYLVTGAAGFIGSFTCLELLRKGHQVTGIDNLNDYYSVQLKKDRQALLAGKGGYRFELLDIADRETMDRLFSDGQFDVVINLAAQAGVRYSLSNPHAYADSNLVGFTNVLEGCRHHNVKHLVFASSSSVYGANAKLPFSVEHGCDHPISLYAATKRCNEMMAHSYAHLYNLPVTGLRFFTVYGPWGRPDMAAFLFTKKILSGEPIDVFNNGVHRRDFTFVDDIVDGVVKVSVQTAEADPSWSADSPNPATSEAPYRIYNIGNNQSVALMDFIKTIEKACGREAELNFLPMQTGDVEATYANIDAIKDAVGFEPKTSINVGIPKFVKWYRDYYQH
ncbi:NAD-dependent epimerase [Alphaproteobacteria bacterium]|nr:NAD-dependent epimerase [Alphaproteobacteria bacterium]